MTPSDRVAAVMRLVKEFECMAAESADYGWPEHDAMEAKRAEIESAVHELAAQAVPEQPAPPAIPDGWVPLRIEYEPGYPEDVAFGPQRMMDRLKKWLDRYFAMRLAAPASPAAQPAEPMTLDEFFREAKARNLTAADLVPGLIDNLAAKGDPEAIAAKARLAAQPPALSDEQPAEREAKCEAAKPAEPIAHDWLSWQPQSPPLGPSVMWLAEPPATPELQMPPLPESPHTFGWSEKEARAFAMYGRACIAAYRAAQGEK